MDFVPGEPESVLAGDLDGVLVTRSLTKLWGSPGCGPDSWPAIKP